MRISASFAGHLAQAAFAIQVFAVLFSLGGPVPINNRIKLWTPANLPADWRAQERRWDLYHWFRTVALIVAFVCWCSARCTEWANIAVIKMQRAETAL